VSEATVADFGYVGGVALLQGGTELLRASIEIDHPGEAGWSGQQSDQLARAPKRFIPEPHPITVVLLDGIRRGETAQAMVAVIHGRIYMVGTTEFLLHVAAAS
jgi:hypothetical protein